MVVDPIPLSELNYRRSELQKLLPPGSSLLIVSEGIQIRNNDTEYYFRQNSNFWYFTGLNKPNSAILITKTKCHVFYENTQNNPYLRTGVDLPITKIAELTGVDNLHKFSDLRLFLTNNLETKSILYVDLEEISYSHIVSDIEGLLRVKKIFQKKAKTITGKLRSYKSRWEIEQLQKAAKINIKAQLIVANRVMNQKLEKGFSEYNLLAEVLSFYYKNRSNWSFMPVLASGSNSAYPHYNTYSSPLKLKSLLLTDIGCEYNYYASDITRTWPIGGKFSSAQKDIYRIVLKANQETIKLLKSHPKKNLTFADLQKESVRHITQGLVDIGILKGNLEQNITNQNYKAYYGHSVSHHLGLDAHDYIVYKDENQNYYPLEAGMVITVEPALYFCLDDQTVPKKYRGLGVRIEDDILLTETSYINLTKDLPKLIPKIESI